MTVTPQNRRPATPGGVGPSGLSVEQRLAVVEGHVEALAQARTPSPDGFTESNYIVRADGTIVSTAGGASVQPEEPGDLLTADAEGAVLLGVGNDGDVLTADSSEGTGLVWAPPAVAPLQSPLFGAMQLYTEPILLSGAGALEATPINYVPPAGATQVVFVAYMEESGATTLLLKRDGKEIGAGAEGTTDSETPSASRTLKIWTFTDPTAATYTMSMGGIESHRAYIYMFTVIGRERKGTKSKGLVDANADESLSLTVAPAEPEPIFIGLTSRRGQPAPISRPGDRFAYGNGKPELRRYFEVVTGRLVGEGVEETLTWAWEAVSDPESAADSAGALVTHYG